MLIDTDPPGTSVIGENTFIRSPTGSGVLIPVVASDVLNTGSAAAQAITTVKADTKTPQSQGGTSARGSFTLAGDVNGVGTSTIVTTIAPSVVSNSKLALMPSGTVKANLTGSSANPTDVTLAALATALGTGGGSPSIVVTQTAHGFTAGQVVYFNGTTYILAIGTSAVTAEVVGMVTSPITTNTFTLLAVGPVTLSGLTAGTYFLDTVTAGNITQTDPNVSGSAGQVSKPLGFALSTTQFFFMPMRGDLLTSSPVAGFQTVSLLSTTTGINAKTIANTTLYTPSGKTALATTAIVLPTLATAITVGPTIGIGTNATPSNIFAQTALTAVITTAQAYNFSAPGVFVVAPSGTPILAGVTSAATGTAMTVTIYLFGILV